MTSSCPLSIPDAPTISSVNAADASLTVSFTAGPDGGSPITNYKYSIDGINYVALNPARTTSPFTISGLTNGTTYSVTIKAVNTIGESPSSNAVTGRPMAPTSTPTSVGATNGTLLPETGKDSSAVPVIGLFFAVAGLVLTSRRRSAQQTR